MAIYVRAQTSMLDPSHNCNNSTINKIQNRTEPVDEWQFGLFSCIKGGGVCKCLKMTFCMCCMNGRAISVGLERGYVGCCLCGLPGLCCLRTKLRTKYNIEGTKCEDSASCMFCLPCTSCQFIQEVEYQQKIDIHWNGKTTERPKANMHSHRKGRKGRKVKTTKVAQLDRKMDMIIGTVIQSIEF